MQKLLSFFKQKYSVFGYKVVKHLTRWPLNELVKLTMLWTTGPWWLWFSRTSDSRRLITGKPSDLTKTCILFRLSCDACPGLIIKQGDPSSPLLFMFFVNDIVQNINTNLQNVYTPGIYAAGYIVFALTFVRSSVRMFVRSFVRSFVCSFVRYFPSRS